MKKLLIVLGVVAAFLTATAFVTAEKSNTLPGPGDGKYSCEIYGSNGVVATVVNRVITPNQYGTLKAEVRLNESTKPEKQVVVELRDYDFNFIEGMTIEFPSLQTYRWQDFRHKGSAGEVYYVTINRGSCK